jgi:uncharacterized protein (TIGR03086 family)
VGPAARRPVLLLVPAVLFVGTVAGARQSRKAAVGTGIAFMGTLATLFLVGNDILLYEAARSNDPGAIALVHDYQHNVLFGAMLVLYIGGQVLGFVLLAIALWRTRPVPRWAAVAVGAFPIVGFVLPPRGRRAGSGRLGGLRADPATRGRRAVASRHLHTGHACEDLSRSADEMRGRHVDPTKHSVPPPTRQARPGGLALDLLARANEGFAQRLGLVRPHQWTAPTPCAAWDVQALVNHVVGANRRYTMLLHGATADEVEATRTADHLGDDPVASLVATADELNAAFREPGAMGRTAHHPTGDRTGTQLLEMRVVDVTVHTWDLARAIGSNESLDPDLVAFALTLRGTFDAGREHGSFAPPPGEMPADHSAQARLLHVSGRRPG